MSRFLNTVFMVFVLTFTAFAGLHVGTSQHEDFSFGTNRASKITYGQIPVWERTFPETEGLVAWWKLDGTNYNGTIGEVSDSSGHGNNGTAHGTSSAFIDGRACQYFDGSSAYIDCGTNASLNLQTLTVTCWIKGDVFANQSLVTHGGYGWSFILYFDEFMFGKNWIAAIATTSAIRNPEWQFLTAVCSDSGGVKTAQIYIDSVLQATGTYTGNFENNKTVTLGAEISPYDNMGAYFCGDISDVRIYNRALSSNEVMQVYQAGFNHHTDKCAVYLGDTLVSNPTKRNLPKKSMTGSLTFAFVTGTVPTSFVLGDAYAGPAVAANALYDAGDGVWRRYTSKTIPMHGNYIKFDGDWRTASDNYYAMFSGTLNSDAYTVKLSGRLKYAACGASAYREVFRWDKAITEIVDNPFQKIDGSPSAQMFWDTFLGCNSLTSIPSGTLDTSGLTGAPSAQMFWDTFLGCNSLTSIPSGTLDTSGLTGAPSVQMFVGTFHGCSKFSNDIHLGSNITFTSANVSDVFENFLFGCSSFTNRVYWGGNLLTTEIPVPDSKNAAFAGCINMPGYSELNTNWK